MPYIKYSKRDVLDPAINQVLDALHQLADQTASTSVAGTNNMEGNVNYVFTRILQNLYPGRSYQEVNDAVGIMGCCTMEYYRRIAAPLEDEKAIENGDVLPTRGCNYVR